ncbi:MAG TPA: type II CAAX endopeptidase family protein [Bryobacteraceae bacterium]|nr:type II CAAX endopeptidase family protein [Bryobacteraceae bacterium]
MKERLASADYRFIVICLALLGGCIWFTAGNFYRAFPEASIDFRVSRDDAEPIARQFLQSQGYHLAGYRDASSFTYDDDAKTFLEREAGLERANRLMGTRVHLWRWAFRWFRPQQKEEFRADVTPTGEVVGFDHEIAEDASSPDISTDEARTLAETYLRTRAHRDPASLEFVESSSVARPHRTDRTFTWKERDFDIHDGTYRVTVTLLGNEVGEYREYVKVPDQWSRDYERLRSKNNEAQTIDTLALVALMIALIGVIAGRVRRQDIRWRRAAIVGVIGMVLSFLSSLNQFPLAEYGYPTTDAYSSFVIQNLVQMLLEALAWGGALFVIAAGAEALYREAFPAQVSLGSLFSRRGLRTRKFFLGAILGVTLCAIFLAYQTIFYIVANKLGAWSPADVPYSDLLNTKFPWAYVLVGGYLPAVSEEFMFRMFSIPFLRKLLRWMPAAIVVAGFTWGFGHAGYPNQPFFIRGLEVGIGGVALGLIMLRWGILPTLIWHYSVDAMYSALLLLRSHSLYFKLSGAASAGIFVAPILIALVAYWRHGGFEPTTGLLNGDEPAPAPAPPAVEQAPVGALHYWPLSGRMRVVALAVFAIGLATVFIPTTHFGESPSYKLTADQARAPADRFVRSLGMDPAGYRQVTYPETHTGGDDGLAAKYFLERRTVSGASKLFEQNRPVQYWATRYFKSLDKDEFLVTVNPESGKVMGFDHQMADDSPGADITPDAARPIAASFAEAQGYDVANMDLKVSVAEKRKARRDYTLAWEARAGDARNVDEAHYRVEVSVDGDRVSGMREYWKIPEAFERSRDRQNFISLSVSIIRIMVTAGAIVFGLWLLIGQVRKGLVPWRRALQVAAIPTVLAAVVEALSFHIFLYRSYQTSIPLETFTVTSAVVIAIQVLFAFAIYGAAVALVLSFFPESTAAFSAARRVFAFDALTLLLLAAGLWMMCHQFGAILVDRFHALAFVGVEEPTLVGTPWPAFTAIADVARSIFVRTAMLALGVLAVRMISKRWMLAALVLLAACAMVPGDIRTAGEFAIAYAPALALVVCAAIFCVYFARRNYLAYVLVLAAMAVYPALAELFGSVNAGLAIQGWMVVAAMVLALGWAVVPGLIASHR